MNILKTEHLKQGRVLG